MVCDHKIKEETQDKNHANKKKNKLNRQVSMTVVRQTNKSKIALFEGNYDAHPSLFSYNAKTKCVISQCRTGLI